MKLIKVIYKKRLNDNGYPQTMYYLETDTFKRLAIKPAFKDDYDKLDFISEFVYDDTEKNDKYKK